MDNMATRRSTRTTTPPTSENDAKKKKLIQLNIKTTPKTGKTSDRLQEVQVVPSNLPSRAPTTQVDLHVIRLRELA